MKPPLRSFPGLAILFACACFSFVQRRDEARRNEAAVDAVSPVTERLEAQRASIADALGGGEGKTLGYAYVSRNGERNALAYFASQFALAPILLVQGTDEELVLADVTRRDLEGPWLRSHPELEVLERLTDGLLLLRRRESGR